MNAETKQLLIRWQSLEKDGGLQHAVSRARALWFLGLALCIFVVFAVIYRLHPAFAVVAAAAMGWVIDGAGGPLGGLIKGKPGISGTRARRSHGGDRGGSLLHGRGARRKVEADERARVQ